MASTGPPPSGADPAGRRASMADATGTTAYAYDSAGRLTGIASPNGVAGTLGYDSADRLTSLAYAQGSTGLESVAYTLDAVGDRTQMTDSAGATTFGYDALGRLASASYPNGDAVGYAYDAVGNRTGLTVNGATTTDTFDAADRLTAAGGTSYTYDADGNELTKTASGVTTTYTYNLLNRLTGIGGPTTASYRYNGDGLRVAKTVGTTATSYAWDPTGLGTVLSDGAEYVWGRGLISQVAAGGTTYAQADGLGSVRLLTDASGNVAGRQQYDAYGASRSQSGAQLPFGFTGEQQDPESGLVYLRARYLDPATGRFLSRDTFGGVGGDPQSLNRFGYAEGDPVANTDPSGHCLPGCLIPLIPVLPAAAQAVQDYGPEIVDTIKQAAAALSGRGDQPPDAGQPTPSTCPDAADGAGSGASTTFFSVQNSQDTARLLAGGDPWPTDATRAALGAGLYAFGSRTEAEAYRNALIGHGAPSDIQILSLTISNQRLNSLTHLDVDSLPDPDRGCSATVLSTEARRTMATSM